MNRKLLLLISMVLLFSLIFAADYAEVIKIVASDRDAYDEFAYSVSISGNYAIVGAFEEDEDTAGNNTMYNAGSAYIYEISDSSWVEKTKLVASDRNSNDGFGYSVSISGDYAIVGAYEAGSAYIFERIDSMWIEVIKLEASDHSGEEWFGYSVSISGDYAIVGASLDDKDSSGSYIADEAGSAYIFERIDSVWTVVAKLVASDQGEYDYFGGAVSISGEHAIVGAYYDSEDLLGTKVLSGAGSAYIFKREDSTWVEETKIIPADRRENDYFGMSVSISGNHAIVGAEGNHLAYLFSKEDTLWTQKAKLFGGMEFGSSVSIAGDYFIVGAESDSYDANWGSDVYSAGSAYIFKLEGDTCKQEAKLLASDREENDHFGMSVSISENYAIVGTSWEDDDALGANNLDKSGSAYVFSIKRDIPPVAIMDKMPNIFTLYQSYPNPFNPAATIDYYLPQDMHVDLTVYDLSGKEVYKLVSAYQTLGYYSVHFNALNLQSGLYIYRLSAGNKSLSKKMVLLK